MNICVVTPYFNADPAWLRQAHHSVLAQTTPARHILVCDGSAPAEIDNFHGTHILLGRNYSDYGNTPRLIGCYRAISEGADAIAFLDADNWYRPDHLASLRNHALANGLAACCSARTLHRPDGSLLAKCQVVNARPYIDTSCLLVMKPAFPHLITWAINSQDIAAVVDQAVWQAIAGSGAPVGFLDNASVCYRTRHAVHYQLAGVQPPPEAINRSDTRGDHYQ